MAGGIFTDRPFELNIKCVYFSMYSALLYYLGGGNNLLLIALIFVISYVLLAWYDYAYDCNTKMRSGNSPIGTSSIFKPQYSSVDKIYKRKVYFFHVAFVAPLLLYIGYNGSKSNSDIWAPTSGLGALTLAYHGLNLYM